jgi:hypothetical protein
MNLNFKWAFDYKDKNRNQPYPNLWSKTIREHYDSHNEPYRHRQGTGIKYHLHTVHSEMFHANKNNYVILDNEYNLNYNLIYPIESAGSLVPLIDDNWSRETFKYKYTSSFKTNVSPLAVSLAKQGKLKFAFNYSHECNVESKFFYQLAEDIIDMGLTPDMFIFFLGQSNILELKPKLKQIGFTFNFEDAILHTSAYKINMLYFDNPNIRPMGTHLGYRTKMVAEDDINIKRNKHFICPNRNVSYNHRFTLGCFFEYKKWWDDIYASFLFTHKPEPDYFIHTGDEEFDNNIKSVAKTFYDKIGTIEIDTKSVKNKEHWDGQFEGSRSFGNKEYRDSYIYIATETVFSKELFVSDKPFNGVVQYQPFILFSNAGYLKHIKKYGFETFSEFIDESYDEIEDEGQRFLALCRELERLKNIPLEKVHEWYVSIKDKLIHNRKLYLSFGDKTLFVESLNKEFNERS